MEEFIIPAEKDDLLTEATPGSFAVREELSITSMSAFNVTTAASDVFKALSSKDALAITTNEVFDPLYSLLKNFSSLDDEAKVAVCKGLINATATIVAALPPMLQGAQTGTSEHTPFRNAVKMVATAFSWLSLAAEAEAMAESKHMEEAPKKGKGKKAEAAAVERAWSWERERVRVVGAMVRLVQMELARLWPMACPEEPFVNLFTRAAYVFLENPAVSKDKDSRDSIFALLGILVQRYNHSLGAVTSIIHMLPLFEHLAAPMAQLMEVFVNEYNGARVVGEVAREIGRMDPQELARDASGARAFAAFLTELGERVPGALLPHVSLLMGLMDGEAYCMRNAVLEVLGAMVRTVLLNNRDEAAVASRDQFLDILESRMHDVAAFVRSRVCQIWYQLVDSRSVPLSRLRTVTPVVAARLQDKSSVVRRSALALLSAMIKKNPYADKLDADSIHAKLVEAQATLARLQGDAGQQAPSAGEHEDQLMLAAEAAKAAAQSSADSETVQQQRVLVQYLTDSHRFAQQLHTVTQTAAQLLGSKTNTDVKEAVEFFVTAAEFKVAGSLDGVRKMLALMWSKDTDIRQTTMDAYRRLYLSPDPAVYTTQKACCAIIVKNLIELTQGASQGDLASMEEMICTMITEGAISASVVKLLWDVFALRVSGTTEPHSRGALVLLGMAARAQPEIVRENTATLVSVGFGPRAKSDMFLVRDTCVALQKLAGSGSKKDVSARFPATHALFEKIVEVLSTCDATTPGWIPAAEQGINAIYMLAESPDVVCGQLLHALTRRAAPSSSISTSVNNSQDAAAVPALAQLLFAVGHVALKQLVHVEAIQSEIKRRRHQEDEKQEKSKKKDAAEEDMGVAAAADDAEAEYLQQACERELVAGASLLAAYVPMIVAVCRSPHKYPDVTLQTAAVLALCKTMCVYAPFCEQNLQLLFTIMKTSPAPTIRANTIVCMGDLAFRFPNIIEPWTPQLYAMLRDADTRVRKNALMVLTHLILNDMVKVKGQIAEMAVCLEDKERRIADLACLFFHELSGKNNAIYNLLPDIISQLAEPAAGIDPQQFQNIMGHLFGLIKKEKQCESLVEKLCHRFRATQDVQQWRHYAYCLSQVTYSDKSIKKLTENFACFEGILGDAEVFACFMDIISKAKKFAVADLKGAVGELEARLSEKHQLGAENNAAASKAAAARQKARQRKARTGGDDEEEEAEQTAEKDGEKEDSGDTKATARGKPGAAAKGGKSRKAAPGGKAAAEKKSAATTAKRGKKAAAFSQLDSDDDDGDNDNGADDAAEDEDNENTNPNPPRARTQATKAQAPSARAAPSRRRVIMAADSDNDDDAI